MSDQTQPQLVLIAAVAANGAIGKDNQLLWRLPEDMQRFKALTQGHPVIMGRKTWESLPERFRPLPNRRNIVISRNPTYAAPGAEVFTSLAEARAACSTAATVFVIGGGELYAEAIKEADRLEMTEVHQDFDGDAFFPEYPRDVWRPVFRDCLRSAEGLAFDFVTYTRS